MTIRFSLGSVLFSFLFCTILYFVYNPKTYTFSHTFVLLVVDCIPPHTYRVGRKYIFKYFFPYYNNAYNTVFCGYVPLYTIFFYVYTIFFQYGSFHSVWVIPCATEFCILCVWSYSTCYGVLHTVYGVTPRATEFCILCVYGVTPLATEFCIYCIWSYHSMCAHGRLKIPQLFY